MKVEKSLTLSEYKGGMHRTSGEVHDTRDASFAESLSPLSRMAADLQRKGARLGQRVKVTMEVEDERP